MKKVIFFSVILFLIFPALGQTKQRIISLSPPITEELFFLGLGKNIVGNTIYCVRPNEARNIEKVGTVISVNVEKIIRLKPEVVFASPLTDKKSLEKLKKMGISVHIFPHPKNFFEICERFLKLSEMVGKKEFASSIVKESEKNYRQLKEIFFRRKKKPTVFVELGSNPLFTATKDSIITSFIEDANGVNIALDSKIGLFSVEEVILRNPEYIIIVGMGMEAEKERKRWLKYKRIKAVSEKKLYIVDPYTFCSPTVESYVSGLREIGEILSGGIKNEKKGS